MNKFFLLGFCLVSFFFLSETLAKPYVIDKFGNKKPYSCQDYKDGTYLSASDCLDRCRSEHGKRCVNQNGKIYIRTDIAPKKAPEKKRN